MRASVMMGWFLLLIVTGAQGGRPEWFSQVDRQEEASLAVTDDTGLYVGVDFPRLELATESVPTTVTLDFAILRALHHNRLLRGSLDGVESSLINWEAVHSRFNLEITPQMEGGLQGDSEGEVVRTERVGLIASQDFMTGTRVEAGPQVTNTEGGGTEYELGAAVQQPLIRIFDKDVLLDDVRSAEFSFRSARRSLHLAQVDTIITTVSAVYGVIRQREQVAINRESLTRLEANLSAVRLREKVSTINPVDAFRVQVEVQQAKDALENSLSGLEDANDNLKVILALPLGPPVYVMARTSDEEIMLEEEMALEIAYDNRVELVQAEDIVKESKRRSKVARYNIYPDLDLRLAMAQYGTHSDEEEEFALNKNRWSGSLGSSFKLFRRREKAALQQSYLDIRAAERNLDQQRDEISRQVRRSLRELARLKSSQDLQRVALDRARSQLQLAKLRYKSSLATNFDVIDAEQSVKRSQIDLLSAQIGYTLGLYRLRASLGTLVEKSKDFE